jgi:hypothetical protein
VTVIGRVTGALPLAATVGPRRAIQEEDHLSKTSLIVTTAVTGDYLAAKRD